MVLKFPFMSVSVYHWREWMVLQHFWKGIEYQSPYIPKILGLNPGPLHARQVLYH